MEQSLQQISGNIETYRYFAVFSAMLLTGIGLPLPGELTLGLTGYLVYSGQMDLTPAVLATALGDLLGAVISYQLGRFGRNKIIARYFSFLIPAESKLVAIEDWLNKYGAFAVVVGRVLPVIRGAVPVSAGFVHMPGKVYMLGSAVSSIIWCSALIYLGMGLGNNWRQITEFGNSMGFYLVGVVLAGVLIWYLSILRKKLK
ncbi:MAG: associated Golgi protein [Firmicutes bacterium]|nr:associated Golgi protein [Bacillota bacterium]